MSKNALTTGSSLRAETKKALGLLKDTITQVESDALSLDELSRCNAHQNPFENAAKAYSRQIENQLKYYRDRWGFSHTDTEFGSLHIPHPRGYCKTLLILSQELVGPEDVFSRWISEKKFDVWKWDSAKSLNDLIPNDRRLIGHYALLHSGRQEGDAELKNCSWEQNIRERRETMRATECFLWEDQFYTEHKEHTDNKDTVTLTSSRDVGGCAVRTYWYPVNRKFCVSRSRIQDVFSDLCARAAVIL